MVLTLLLKKKKKIGNIRNKSYIQHPVFGQYGLHYFADNM